MGATDKHYLSKDREEHSHGFIRNPLCNVGFANTRARCKMLGHLIDDLTIN